MHRRPLVRSDKKASISIHYDKKLYWLNHNGRKMKTFLNQFSIINIYISSLGQCVQRSSQRLEKGQLSSQFNLKIIMSVPPWLNSCQEWCRNMPTEFNMSQGAPLRDFLLRSMCPMLHSWTSFAILNQRGCCERQSFCQNCEIIWGSQYTIH